MYRFADVTLVVMRVARRAAVVLATLLLAAVALAGPATAAPVGAQPLAQVEAPPEQTDPEQTDPTAPAVPEVPEVAEVPDIAVDLDGGESDGVSRTVSILLLLTAGSLAPGLLLLMTSFTRFIIVLSITKQAMGLQSVPPPQVLIGLALFLTFSVMGPVLGQVYDDAVQPLLAGEIDQEEAFDAGYGPLREFMLAQTDDRDLALFMDIADAEQPTDPDEVGAATLVPAFALSEMRTAFIAGFVIFIPFLVIDLVVASVLLALGAVMVPPVFISLPVKLLVFILVDGWVLIVGSLVDSVQAAGGV